MYISVKAVKPLANYEILLTFKNDEQRIFDVKPFLNLGKFAELRNESLFRSVHVSFDTVEWNNGMDLDPEMLYEKSRSIETCTESKVSQ
jgi:hypothetical protein